jgi:thymidylate synthase (FAD)
MIKATLMDYMGSDVTVVNAARVSFGKRSSNTYTTYKDDNLIWYLADHKHMSPFGHCFASFHVKAPIFVARQLVKHKFLRWNEISRRYVDDDMESLGRCILEKKCESTGYGQ